MKYTRFEKARMVGARALQISLGAPILVDYPEDILDPVLRMDQGTDLLCRYRRGGEILNLSGSECLILRSDDRSDLEC